MEQEVEKRYRHKRPIALLLGTLMGLWPSSGWAFDDSQLKVERVPMSAVKAVGIVPYHARKTGALPVDCGEVPNGWGVTISRELLETYRKRGFSRTAVCLGLGSTPVYFDPETGQQLELYDDVGMQGPRPLWLPNCFRKIQVTTCKDKEMRKGYLAYVCWRPTGCTARFNPSTGVAIKRSQHIELVAGGEAGGGVDEDNQSSTISEDRLRSLVNGK
jgi:hypothetical protein